MEPENPGLEMMKAAAEGAGRESVSKLFGSLFPFLGIKKKAIDVYVADIENSNLNPESKMLAIANVKKTFKELKNQMAIAEIAQNAAKDGTDFSAASSVSDEFVSRLLDAGKYVSDEEAQVLWGNVLAGEFESPGSTPWSVIRILSELTKKYAEIFSNLCSLQFDYLVDNGSEIVKIDACPLVNLSDSVPYLIDLGITFSTMQELERLGLVNMDSLAGYIKQISYEEYPQVHLISGTSVITISTYRNRSFPLGSVILTEAGKCIARFVPRKYNSEHISAAKKLLEKNGAICSPTPGITIIGVREGKTGTEYNYQRLPITRQQTQEPQ